MDPVDQPGASKPKSDGGPSETIGEADVEKTLERLESMTTTLVQEVGTQAAKAPAPQAAAAPPADAPAAAESPRDLAPNQPPAPAEPTVAVAEQESPADELQAAEPPADSAKAQAALSADAEVEQEISQAIQQLQGGNAPAAEPRSTENRVAAAARTRSGLLRRLVRIVDAIFSPLALLVTVLDLPFRRLPGAVRQILGYVAVGTALMAGALWYYILMSHPR